MSDAVTSGYVRARWAYSELLSGRPYGPGVQGLKRKALAHVAFEDLSREEHDMLEQAWYRVRGVRTFINAFAGIAAFDCVHWSKEQLGAVYVIKFFGQEVVDHSVARPSSNGLKPNHPVPLNRGTLATQHQARPPRRELSQ